MRWREISEAPLGDFAAYGDMDHEGSFRPEDMRAMRNPKWVKKVETAFSKTPYRFNVYLYNAPGGEFSLSGPKYQTTAGNIPRHHGIQSPRDVENVIGKLPQEAASSISILFIENEGNERIPLTPWILAHRVIHALFAAAQMRRSAPSDMFENKEKLNKTFTAMFRSAYTALATSPLYHDQLADPLTITDISARDIAQGKALAPIIGKLRSMREGNLANRGEFLIELVTQYLVQGRVSFNRVDLGDEAASSAFSTMLDEMEGRFNEACDGLFASCVGRCFML